MDPHTPRPVTPVPQHKSWWSRNWLWVLPTGCLTMVALAVTFVLVIFLVVFGAMKSTDAPTASRTFNRESRSDRLLHHMYRPPVTSATVPVI